MESTNHWFHYFEGAPIYANLFYKQIIEEIKALGFDTITTFYQERREGGMFSKKRTHLAISISGEIVDKGYIIYTASVKGWSFISWRRFSDDTRDVLTAQHSYQGDRARSLAKGRRFYGKKSFYKGDALELKEIVLRKTIMKVINETIEENGLRPLENIEQSEVIEREIPDDTIAV